MTDFSILPGSDGISHCCAARAHRLCPAGGRIADRLMLGFDRKIPPACKPPPIRDRKTESANPRYGEGFFSKLLDDYGQMKKITPRSAHIPAWRNARSRDGGMTRCAAFAYQRCGALRARPVSGITE